jgi:hypothetical protein
MTLYAYVKEQEGSTALICPAASKASLSCPVAAEGIRPDPFHGSVFRVVHGRATPLEPA